MDRIYRSQRHIYDLTRKYYLLGRDRLIQRLAPPDGGAVLEVGCGTGRNLIAVARAYQTARLYGFDISEEMLRTARANVARAGLADRITLYAADATQRIGAPDGRIEFDRAYCSYVLSMIPDWPAAMARAVDALTPDGRYEAVDFGDQARLPAWFKRSLYAWLRQFHVEPRVELEDVARKTAQAHGRMARFESLYRGYAWAVSIQADA